MFQENVLLKHHSNYKIGGLAKYFFEAKSIEEIIKAVEKARLIKTPFFILGGGTNILFNDEGFDGLIIKIKNSRLRQGFGGQAKIKIIKVDAGVFLERLVEESADTGLSGLEWAAGIPGTLGGAIRGNAGAFGGEIKDVIKEVISLDISGLRSKIIKRNNQDCKFNYRSSIFKSNGAKEIIIEASLLLRKGNRKSIETAIKQNINYRKERQPMEYPSLGSTFKNIDAGKIAKKQHKSFELIIKNDPFPVIPAAYLISKAGLNGVSCGGAMISPKHPNFIVNVLNATASDVKNLIALVKKEVYKKFRIDLEEEIEIL
ncbi:MAG: UDP-N-acetylmuramate dehydrogenase [bacterium]|nr:UDP-N-acetylmuramate dehydrogenase [bacterium]